MCAQPVLPPTSISTTSSDIIGYLYSFIKVFIQLTLIIILECFFLRSSFCYSCKFKISLMGTPETLQHQLENYASTFTCSKMLSHLKEELVSSDNGYQPQNIQSRTDRTRRHAPNTGRCFHLTCSLTSNKDTLRKQTIGIKLLASHLLGWLLSEIKPKWKIFLLN